MTFDDQCKLLSERAHINMRDLMNCEFSKEFTLIINELKSTSGRQILYHAILGNNNIPKCICGNNLNWHPDLREYRKYCCNKCQGIGTINQRKEICLEKYGVEFNSQRPEFKDLIHKTSQKKWGVDHYTQTSEYNKRVKQTSLEKYGTEHYTQAPEVIQRNKNTCMERYGVTCSLHHPPNEKIVRQTMVEKYGAEYPLQSSEILEKTKQTNLIKYGVENPNQNKEILVKRSKTRKENYYSEETLLKLSDLNWLKTQQSTLAVHEIATAMGDISSSTLGKYFNKMDIEVKYHWHSSQERRLLYYYTARNINIETRNRKIIYPLELDIIFPDHKVAVEIDGVYFHSEEFKSDKFFHRNKTISVEKTGYKLLHFWDLEINNNFNKVVDKINHLLGLNTRIYARKLKIIQVSSDQKKRFFTENHLQNDCNSSINIGLVNEDNELMMCASFGKSRYNKKYSYELLRLASKLNFAVVGGASKLLKYFKINYMSNNETLISYCNRRWSSGNMYSLIGMKFERITTPNYEYVLGGKLMGSREKFQKHKLSKILKIFDPTLTESDNMKINGYYRLWDCGQLVFTLR